MENKVTPYEIIELIESLPDSESHIFEDNKVITITDEWLCGTFAGRGFYGDTKEEAAKQLIDYLYRHIGHNSMVGKIITKSGFPDLEKVKNIVRNNEINKQTINESK